jgi:cyclic pyranopterin phosphate synthase
MLDISSNIPLRDVLTVPALYQYDSSRPLVDRLSRPLRDLRISVTDRCNFRCVYCMPREVFNKDHVFLARDSLLSFEEIERLARVFVSQGVEKIRLTGGEPLLRKNVEFLIERLASLRTPDGKNLDIALTTNGSLLARKAQSLRDAGLSRVTVSLDALDDQLFRRMNDVDYPVTDVLRGIEKANAVGLAPIKINMVVKRNTNDQEILPMARFFRSSDVVLRFIEYMDVGLTNGWQMGEVLSSDLVIARIHNEFPLVSLDATATGETAQRWRYADGAGEVGVISSVTRAFCSTCTRARLSADGKLYLCLFGSGGHDLRQLVRANSEDFPLAVAIAQIWRARSNRYSEQRGSGGPRVGITDGPRIEMSYVGG